MKYEAIIKSMNREQKIAVASDPSALADLKELALPTASLGEVDERAHGVPVYPSYAAMGYAWNTALAQKVFSARAEQTVAEGANVLLTPNAGVKCSPFSNGVSEDPYLCSALVNAFARGCREQGAFPCARSGMDAQDERYLDEKLSERSFQEYFMGAFSKTQSRAFCFPFTPLEGGYANANTKYINERLHEEAKNGGFVLCSDCPPALSVKALTGGNILVGANADSLRSALARYDELKRKVENGEAEVASLNEALENASALSEETLDLAVERVLLFADEVHRSSFRSHTAKADERLALDASEQTVVLLKNEGILPLARGKRIAVLGSDGKYDFSGELCACLEECGVPARSSVGYRADGTPAQEVLLDGVQVAREADIAVVLLSAEKSATNALPANQLALLDELAKHQIPVVGVLCGETVADVSFDERTAGLLFSPALTLSTPRALANLLSGSSSPSGRLTNTFYADPKGYFANLSDYRRMGNAKVGVFVGYRYYDSAGVTVKYPFGYGLSYSQFSYSNLFLQGNTVTFTVKNVGGREASEVVQIYVGKKGSQMLRPQKELKGFVKVTLARGESKSFSVKINQQMLEVFNENKKIVEGGTYQVYVGRSATDVLLQVETYMGGTSVKASGEKESEYLPTQSNVLSDGYTVAPVKAKSKAGRGARKTGVTLMLLSLALFLVGATLDLMGIARQWSVEGYDLFCIFNIYVFPSTFLLGLIILIVGACKGAKAKKRAKIESTGRAHEEQEKVKSQSFRSLFDSLYEQEKEEQKDNHTTGVTAVEQEEFVGEYDPAITFEGVCERLALYLTERGIATDRGLARKILSSFASSRFLVLNANEYALAGRFLSLLAAYFGGSAVEQEIGTSASSLLYREEGGTTPLYALFERSAKSRDSINLAVLKTQSLSEATRVLTPFLRCADRRVSQEIFLYQHGKTQKYALSPNVWFILVCDEQTNVTCEPILGDVACSLYAELTACEEKAEKTSFSPLNFYQFYRMEQKLLRFDGAAAEKYLLDEDRYLKKLDRLEDYLKQSAGYQFGNKLNWSLERFIAVYLACGGEAENAFDCAVAGKIVLTAVNLVGGERNDEGDVVSNFDVIFGEEVADESKRLFSRYLAAEGSAV